MQHVYLSRRNLLTLLSKLDRNLELAESTAVTKVAASAQLSSRTPRILSIHALMEDEEYYVTGDRGPGRVHPADDPRFKS